jgi:hypothetical protein
MSTAGLAANSTVGHSSVPSLLVPADPALCREVTSTGVLRMGNMQQGKALETLGHALEYLHDSRMFLINEPASGSDAQAVQILAGLSRAVFAECAVVKPSSRRWRDWIVGRPPVAAISPR